MSSSLRLVLLAALMSCWACGGRVASRTDDSAPGGSAGNSSVPVDVPGDLPSGGSGATMTPPDDDVAPPFGVDAMPPFETPWWLWANWQDNVGRPIVDQCRPGFGEQEGLAAIHAFADQATAVLVDAQGLVATIDEFHDPVRRLEAANTLVVHLFSTPDAHMAAVSVFRSDTGVLYYYFVFDADCSAQRLGFYVENMSADGCAVAAGSTLWGIPKVPDGLGSCATRTGFYAFEADATEDTCSRSPARFRGVFHYREKDELRAEVVFIDVPLPELRRSSFGFRVDTEDGNISSEVRDATECGPLTMKLLLQQPAQLLFEDERTVCEGGEATTCWWKMQSPKVYGPLN